MRMLYILFSIVIMAAVANVVVYRFLLGNLPYFAGLFKIAGIVVFILSVAFLTVFALGTSNIHSLKWGFYLLLLFSLPQVIFIVYWLVFVLPVYKFPQLQKAGMFLGVALLVVFFLLILHGALIGRTKIITNNVTVTSARLPEEFDGFRILQFSDLHAGSFSDKPEFIGELVQKINELKPDMVVFTGDIVNNKSSELDAYLAELEKIQAPYGVYSILGNHDYGDYIIWNSSEDKKDNLERLVRIQEQIGWQVLNDRSVYITKGQDRIVLIGVQNWGEPPFRTYGDLNKAYKDVDKNLFAVLLSHNPSHWRMEVLPETSIDLMLAGHTHAMQMKIAGFSPIALRYKEWSGLYNEGRRYLYVNEGIGSVFVPMRVGAYPELTVIELKTEKAKP